MDELEPDPGGRRGPILAAILVVVGLAGGAAVRVWTSGRGVGSAASSEPADAPFQSHFSPGAAAMWERLLSAVAKKDSRRFTIAGLVALLHGHKDAAAARAFAEEFARDPKLMEVWEQYVRSQDGLTAAWLTRTLEETPAFVALLNRHAGSQAFQVLGSSVAHRIAQDGAGEGPVPAAAARDSTRLGGGPRRDEPEAAVARSGGALRHQEAVPAALPVGPAPGAIPGPRPGETLAVQAGAPLFDPGEEAPGERPAGDAKEVTRTTPKPGAHEVAKLKELKAAGPDMNAAEFIASMFTTMEKGNRDKLVNLCLSKEVCDPVAACDQAGIYPSCLAACNSNPNCKGRIPPLPPPSAEEPPATGGPTEPLPPQGTDYGDGAGGTGPAPGPPPSPVNTGSSIGQCSHGSHSHVHCHGGNCHTHDHCLNVGHH